MPIQPRPEELPRLWLMSDARNDVVLEDALARLPEGSALVFRHYHLDSVARRERFEMLRSICRSKSLRGRLGDAADMLRITTAHDAAELAAAGAADAHAVMISPVFATRSHPGAPALGPEGFHDLARRTSLPVIALGGMTAERARDLGVARWAAIDGLS